MSLLVVGSVAFDAIETPFGKTDKIIGGAAVYISLAASYFKKETNIISVVGEDFPSETIKLLNAKNINTDGIEVIKGGKTFFWSGKYHIDMNTRDTLETQLNVLEHFNPQVPEAYHQPAYLMLGNLTPQVQMSVIEQLSVRPKLIALDTMNFWMDIALEDLKKVIGKIDLLTINDEEARQLSDEYSLLKAAKKILEMGPKYLIIKKGEHGVLLFDQEKVFFAPALPLEEVFDPTGAGDTFAGGLMGYLSHTDDISFDNLKRAVVVGSAMASFCVEKFGTENLLNLEEGDIDTRIQQFVDLVDFDIELVEN